MISSLLGVWGRPPFGSCSIFRPSVFIAVITFFVVALFLRYRSAGSSGLLPPRPKFFLNGPLILSPCLPPIARFLSRHPDYADIIYAIRHTHIPRRFIAAFVIRYERRLHYCRHVCLISCLPRRLALCQPFRCRLRAAIYDIRQMPQDANASLYDALRHHLSTPDV